jgi:hypothetical protein
MCENKESKAVQRKNDYNGNNLKNKATNQGTELLHLPPAGSQKL